MELLWETLTSLNIWSVLFRILLAALFGGCIGGERGRHGRAAGLRTHILVCLGATMTSLIGMYSACVLGYNGDPLRGGAQVVSGSGFLGAGTIMVRSRAQVTGLTTAAGLWASACMGLAIGAGFYTGALFGCVLIIATTALFSKLESFILARSRNINLYVEFEKTEDLTKITTCLHERNVRIYDVELSKARQNDSKYPGAIFSLKLPKKVSHASIVTEIASIKAVRTIEEL